MAKKQSSGRCALCGYTSTRAPMGKHLDTCDKWVTGPVDTFHLLVRPPGRSPYWLHVAAAASVTLTRLDRFLRDLWLECCGHMRRFSIQGRELAFKTRLGDLLDVGATLEYQYDFGTPTDLVLEVVGRRQSKLSGRRAVQVLARNDPPAYTCVDCGTEPAASICSSCSWEGGGTVCAHCSEDHECGEDMLLPLVNSPRTGVCGYTGPVQSGGWVYEGTR